MNTTLCQLLQVLEGGDPGNGAVPYRGGDLAGRIAADIPGGKNAGDLGLHPFVDDHLAGIIQRDRPFEKSGIRIQADVHQQAIDLQGLPPVGRHVEQTERLDVSLADDGGHLRTAADLDFRFTLRPVLENGRRREIRQGFDKVHFRRDPRQVQRLGNSCIPTAADRAPSDRRIRRHRKKHS